MTYFDLLRRCDALVSLIMANRLAPPHLVGSAFYLTATRPLVRVLSYQVPALLADLEAREIVVTPLTVGIWEADMGFGITICLMED